MEAIVKKMQAMKVQKDNAMDDADTWEVKARDANTRRAKLEEELDNLIMKSQKLEVELDKAKEELVLMEEKLEQKDSALSAGELELSNLNRQVQEIENSLEDCDNMMTLAVQKLDKADTACDDNERLRKVMKSKAHFDEERMLKLEEELKEMRTRCEEADNKYEEVQKKVNQTEAELEKAEDRGEMGEFKIIEMEEELRVVANNLKSLEVSEEKANARETNDKATVKFLSAKLKRAESRAEFAEKSVQKLQKEVSTTSERSRLFFDISGGPTRKRSDP